MAQVAFVPSLHAEAETDVLVIGAGAAGLVAALRASEAGAQVLVLERDPVPQGSTARSAGLIPAGGTCFQRRQGVVDDPVRFAADMLRKSHGEADAAQVARIAELAPVAIEWLGTAHGFEFTVVDNFAYPGHSAHRMHGLASRSGAELMDRLRAAAEAAGLDILTQAQAHTLFADEEGRVLGVGLRRPDGSEETVACKSLVLACNGYGGARDIVRAEIPEMAEALYFGHPGNQGDALIWGRALGAASRDLSAYQGHGSVAHPLGVLLTWATITEGGFQLNLEGDRFSDESQGYSEQAARVLAQPEGLAVSVFDERVATIARQFEDFRQIEAASAVIRAPTPAALAERLKLPAEAVARAFAEIDAARAEKRRDAFGRDWSAPPPLTPPYCAVRVTGALFHTQGGLEVDGEARVVRANRAPLPNLVAAGGAAVGVSGAHAYGYLSGNGLATAVAYGYVGGATAARIALS